VELHEGGTNTVPRRRKLPVVQSLQLYQNEHHIESQGQFRHLSRVLGWWWRLSRRRHFIGGSLGTHGLLPELSWLCQLSTVEESLLVG